MTELPQTRATRYLKRWLRAALLLGLGMIVAAAVAIGVSTVANQTWDAAFERSQLAYDALSEARTSGAYSDDIEAAEAASQQADREFEDAQNGLRQSASLFATFFIVALVLGAGGIVCAVVGARLAARVRRERASSS